MLGKRLQQIAQFFMNNPEDVAIYNIVEIAKQAGLNQSALAVAAIKYGNVAAFHPLLFEIIDMRNHLFGFFLIGLINKHLRPVRYGFFCWL